MNQTTAPPIEVIAAQIIKISAVVPASLLQFTMLRIVHITAQMEHNIAEINTFFLSFMQSSPLSNSSLSNSSKLFAS